MTMTPAQMMETALAIAVRAHAGQTDKAGVPYILHPLRVGLTFTSDIGRAVGFLHDVLEDTPVTLDDLRASGLHEGIVSAVEILTRRKDEPYADYILRIKPHPLARVVKIADLQDNLARVDQLSIAQAVSLQMRYEKALSTLRRL